MATVPCLGITAYTPLACAPNRHALPDMNHDPHARQRAGQGIDLGSPSTAPHKIQTLDVPSTLLLPASVCCQYTNVVWLDVEYTGLPVYVHIPCEKRCATLDVSRSSVESVVGLTALQHPPPSVLHMSTNGCRAPHKASRGNG